MTKMSLATKVKPTCLPFVKVTTDNSVGATDCPPFKDCFRLVTYFGRWLVKYVNNYIHAPDVIIQNVTSIV